MYFLVQDPKAKLELQLVSVTLKGETVKMRVGEGLVFGSGLRNLLAVSPDPRPRLRLRT